MNSIDKKYQELLQDILDNGIEKNDRTGTGTISVFGRQIRHKMSEGFPLLTTKKMYFKGIVTELLWFLRGDTNIKYLVDNDCHIWNGDAYKNYRDKHLFNEIDCYSDTELNKPNKTFIPYNQEEFINKIKTDDEFAKKWGELGPIYGKQWRGWKTIDGEEIKLHTYEIDQIQNSIDLLKTDPDSRRNIVSAWNVGDIPKMTLPPCHNFFQFYTRELSLEERFELYKPGGKFDIFQEQYPGTHKRNNPDGLLDAFNIPTRAISLMWNQRSVDTFLGLPFNIASYGLLLEIIAKEVNMVPDELIGNLGDTHLYKNHIEQAKEQITREPMELPRLNIVNNPDIINIKDGKQDRFEKAEIWVEDYNSHPTIKAPLSN
jgi:thymidylate synthase